VASLLPPHTVHLRLTHVDAHRRRIALHSPEENDDT
jgi:hypothetical protein